MLEKVAEIFNDCSIIQTGSRVFGDATPDSDWDFVVLVEDIGPFVTHELSNFGFQECSSSKHSDDKHLIVRRSSDNINLILTNCADTFELWRKCTWVSSALRLDKGQRKLLFGAMIDEDLV